MCVVLSGYRKQIWLALFALLALAPSAWPQMQVGDNTTLNLNAAASVGYTGQYDSVDSNSLTYGFNANLTGDYYDPRFLNFQINPYLNQSRLNSTYYSTTSASGVNAVANFLSSSRTPIQFSYERSRDSEGTFNVPGSTGAYRTVGDGQSFGISASYLPEDWPSIQGNYSHSDSSYQIIGNPGNGTSHSNAFGLGSSYELLGTRLSGSYSKIYIGTDTPVFSNSDETLNQNTNQGTLQFAANRQLFKASNLNVTYSRSQLQGNYQGFQTDANFDTVGALLNVTPTSRVNLSFDVNYSSNLSAQYLSSVLTGGTGSAAATTQTSNLTYTSNYLTYNTNAVYNVTKSLSVTGYANRREQSQPGATDSTGNTTGVGTTWTHSLLGGSLGAHYSIAYYFSPTASIASNQNSRRDSTFTGHNASVSYSRRMLGWSASASGSYARSITTTLVDYVGRSYSTNGSVSRNIASWNLALSGSYSNSMIEGLSTSNSNSSSYSASLSRRKFGFSGSYSRNNGSALQVGNNLIPTTLAEPGALPNSFVLFNGESYGFGGSYNPRRRWTIVGSYSRVRYHTLNLVGNSSNSSDQFYFRSEYRFRQLYLVGGFSHLSQAFGTNLTRPGQLNTVYFGVSRRFDIF